jgi:hypothetical protein
MTDKPPNEPIPGQHGGPRPGAGRPKGFSQSAHADPKKTDAYSALAQARAKREVFKAALTEVEYRQKTGELYERGEVLQVIRTAVAIFAEQMRSLPDKLERSAGLTPAQAEIAENEVNVQLEELKGKLMQVMSGE